MKTNRGTKPALDLSLNNLTRPMVEDEWLHGRPPRVSDVDHSFPNSTCQPFRQNVEQQDGELGAAEWTKGALPVQSTSWEKRGAAAAALERRGAAAAAVPRERRRRGDTEGQHSSTQTTRSGTSEEQIPELQGCSCASASVTEDRRLTSLATAVARIEATPVASACYLELEFIKTSSFSFNSYTLEIMNASQPNGLVVPDATLHPVNSASDVIELMRIGLANRAVGSTLLNERSSRSHSVVTIHIRGVDLKTGATIRGALHLVDLAGSERVDRSAVTGNRLKEAQHINKSLSALGDVIFSLSQKNAHVPYRNSKLTQVLQSSLGGHAKTLMFVQINPDVSSYSETLSTLKFAERVSGVELGTSKANKEGKDIRECMEQLSVLKHKIAKKDEEINRLQQLKTQTPRVRTAKRADSPLKHSSSSPGISNLGSKIHHRRTASSGKAMSIGSRAGSDNFSDISDRHSESGSMQSVDDILPHREVMGLPKLSIGAMGPNSADPELVCFGYADSEERLSDISDSCLSMGTETDVSVSSTVELTGFQEQENTSSTQKEQESAPKTPNDRLSKVATRVQKTKAPKPAQTSLWPKLRDPPALRSPSRVTATQTISAPRTSSTSKRWT